MSASRFRFITCSALLLITVNPRIIVAADAKDAPTPSLTEAEEQFLQGLLKDIVFDPTDATAVNVFTISRNPWGPGIQTKVQGWLVPDAKDKPGRVYFTDGASILESDAKQIQKLDFVGACRKYYTSKKEGPKTFPGFEDQMAASQRIQLGLTGDNEVVIAAWLWRLGEKELAAVALRSVRVAAGRDGKKVDDARLISRLKDQLATTAFANLVNAYAARADAEALECGDRLLKLRPNDHADVTSAKVIIDDLRRRQKQGTFGKTTGQIPEEFKSWDANKKVDFLIAALDEVDARTWQQPNGILTDERLKAVIELGDAAVPALIDVLQNDSRLTRSLLLSGTPQPRTMLTVREAALAALLPIMRVRVFDLYDANSDFKPSARGNGKATAEKLRNYWKQFGQLPFDERMMAVLTDAKATFAAKREAASNLAHLNDTQLPRTATSVRLTRPRQTQVNPAVAKFKQPSTAEAILTALDRDLAAKIASAKQDDSQQSGEELVLQYVQSLIDLGDLAIAGECSRRVNQAKKLDDRLVWAFASHALGEPKPMLELAEQFRKGTLFSPTEDNAEMNLRTCLALLTETGAAETERALLSLELPEHPHHQLAAAAILDAFPEWEQDIVLFTHPVCLKILYRELTNKALTGSTLAIEKDMIVRKTESSENSSSIPPFLNDASKRRKEAPERVCDRAAEKLQALVIGLPAYHPLFKDADERLESFTKTVATYLNRFRRLTNADGNNLGVFGAQGAKYIPDIKPLGRPATADDVTNGLAIFHLDGKGKVAELRLPAQAFLKNNNVFMPCLIVQAETGPDGAVHYGVIGQNGTRAAIASELINIR